jgi:hypothetical protein
MPDMRHLVGDHPLQLVAIEVLAQARRHRDHAVLRIASGGKSVHRGIGDEIDLRHRQPRGEPHLIDDVVQLRIILLADGDGVGHPQNRVGPLRPAPQRAQNGDHRRSASAHRDRRQKALKILIHRQIHPQHALRPALHTALLLDRGRRGGGVIEVACCGAEGTPTIASPAVRRADSAADDRPQQNAQRDHRDHQDHAVALVLANEIEIGQRARIRPDLVAKREGHIVQGCRRGAARLPGARPAALAPPLARPPPARRARCGDIRP